MFYLDLENCCLTLIRPVSKIDVRQQRGNMVRIKKSELQEKDERLTLRLPSEKMDFLKRIAKGKNTRLSILLRSTIDSYIKHNRAYLGLEQTRLFDDKTK